MAGKGRRKRERELKEGKEEEERIRITALLNNSRELASTRRVSHWGVKEGRIVD